MRQGKRKYPAIEHREERRDYPLSYQQERILYLDQLTPDGALWNKVSAKRLTGRLNAEAMRAAVEELAGRHAALRTTIELAQPPVQSFGPFSPEQFRLVDLSQGDPGSREQALAEWFSKECREPIAIREGDPLFQAILVQYGADEALLVLKLHHIVSDATTFQLLWRDLKTLYNRRTGAEAGELPQLGIAYGDYALWQKETFEEERTLEQEAYWLEQFKGELPVLDLPADFSPPPGISFRGGFEKLELPDELIGRLKAQCLNKRVILFSALLSAYYVLLHKCSRQDDVVVGTVFAGRHYSQELSRAAGFFVNTVAIRAEVDGELAWEDLVKTVHGKVDEAYYMQDYPFERLVRKLNPDRQHNRNPLFRAMFNMVTEAKEEGGFADLKETWQEAESDATQADLLFDIRQREGETAVWAEYNSDRFRPETVRRLLKMYANLLEDIAERPDARVKELRPTDAAEREKLVKEFNDTRAAYPPNKCIHELFEEQASRTPDRTALVFLEDTMTYEELNRQANRLARYLRDKDIAAGSVVGIMSERSFEMVISILAVLKAGAAYVPVDPQISAERRRYMLEDSNARLLLVHPAPDGADSGPVPVVSIQEALASASSADHLEPVSHTEDLIYIMYTSGSTGKPKGVMVEHGSVLNTLFYMQQTFPVHSNDAHLLKTHFAFDVSVSELFGWFFEGGKLVILEPGAEKEPVKIVKAITEHGVTHANFSPSFLQAFLEDLKARGIRELASLRYAFAAGEALKPHVVRSFHEQVSGTELVNVYGPTETAIYATCHRLRQDTPEEQVPIGAPLANVQAYVLDRYSQLLPIGLIGELCLSGPSLARGYANLPELTAEKFAPNPYRPGERLYRTGDLVRRRDNGTLDYIGRIDQQVKIRGFRIEPGEIEETLASHPSILSAAVIAREDEPGRQMLVAYCVVHPDTEIPDEEWKRHLAEWLPSYMIPSAFIQLETMPLNKSGKVDRSALPAPGLNHDSKNESDQPISEVERKLIGITESILNISGINPNDNFFDLGGNSLLTIRFITEIEQTFGISLSLMDFIDLPVLAKLAKTVESLLPVGAS
ncbi:non-ribosomal peptide synthetase [Paenibacillus durus]|uniref:Carrier domain-containing protein n=1 Tax=Paenibacillus durus ATCC 35681 TaxID=1333534 RepID=A0A0F7F9F9_PAEDU|nr:non-ribosomal peptide synthetase [Paenibacillus durus]AKG35128.1 hypothetical protein VK70_11595 [Paenibacillus durus ATCC 35681]